ncbi:hypothetical protein C922_05073 [Plasmodium inui San Antonio 1]|uniref:Uncharacterized protein n=1 Tax=Plasmodium inui San Antonio 1 TaxID=1237626 RepID=W6ZUY0_9APIC|nr:hypothetical protein C922_05073 [Plasmodium inui San Antonio 1]EUD64557.1 hypothetical protein C922_05073 [Plasmodium inui San Antonio 1]
MTDKTARGERRVEPKHVRDSEEDVKRKEEGDPLISTSQANSSLQAKKDKSTSPRERSKKSSRVQLPPSRRVYTSATEQEEIPEQRPIPHHRDRGRMGKK